LYLPRRFPAVAGEIFACWTIATTFILHLKSSSPNRSSPIYLSSPFLSTLFPLLLIAYFAALIPISLVANSSRESMAPALGNCDRLLGTAEETYTGAVSDVLVQEVATFLFDAVQSSQDALMCVPVPPLLHLFSAT
jgi:hypothetical protein